MSNQTFDVYLTITGKALLNKVLAGGDTLSLTRAVLSSFTSNNPENIPTLEPALLETTQIALTDRGTYCEIELSLNFRNLEEDIVFSSIGIYGKTDSSNETLMYVAMVNADSLMTIPAHSPITYVLSLKETLTQGVLQVSTNASFATPISHNSDFTRHIFSQTNTSNTVALVNSGVDNNFTNGDSIIFVPKVNIASGKKLRIASVDYTLKFTDINGNPTNGTFIAHRPYGMAFNSSDNSFVYREYNGMEIVNGIPHYWTGTAWASTMPAGEIHAFARSSVNNTLYLLCDGSTYNKNNYPELFNAIGHYYGGTGDNFKVPDLRGRGIIGVSSSHSLGSTSGSETASLSISNIPSHRHTFDNTANNNQGALAYHDFRIKPIDVGTNPRFTLVASTIGGSAVPTIEALVQYDDMARATPLPDTKTTGGGTAFNIMNPYIALKYYISTGRSLL